MTDHAKNMGSLTAQTCAANGLARYLQRERERVEAGTSSYNTDVSRFFMREFFRNFNLSAVLIRRCATGMMRRRGFFYINP